MPLRSSTGPHNSAIEFREISSVLLDRFKRLETWSVVMLKETHQFKMFTSGLAINNCQRIILVSKNNAINVLQVFNSRT